ncbi:MAG: hypothetical protein FWE12_08135 [Oscillospiraceae bacterium]|nr:hypothetical protein [Oscillospiraceae bacterium]
MKQQPLAERLFILAALLFLIGILLLTLLRDRDNISHYENRYLATMPEFSTAAVLDGSYFAGIDEFLGDHSAFRITLSRLTARADIHLLGRPVVNNIVVLDDLLLFRFPAEPAPTEEWLAAEANARARELHTLMQLIESYGGHFLYVAVPDQTAYFWEYFPSYINNRQGYRPAVQAFTEAMEAHGVPFLDMGEVFAARGNPRHYYSAVDHHFSSAGAFATYEAIMEALLDQTGLDMPFLRAEDFIFTELPNPYTGSRGRMLWGASPFRDERLTVAEPRTPIPFTRKDNGWVRPATVHDLPGIYWEEVFYGLYMGGDHPLTEIDTNRPHLPSILVFGDSFTNAVESLIYVNFNTMTSIDLRLFDSMSLAGFIMLHQPDIVICIRDYSWILRPEGNGRLFE